MAPAESVDQLLVVVPVVQLLAASLADRLAAPVQFTVTSTNTGPTPTDLSHYNSYVQLRVEGGTVSSVRAGDFDRYEQLTSEADGYKPTTSSRAVVCRLFENLFAPSEVDASGPIRIAGAHPHVFASWRLTMPDG